MKSKRSFVVIDSKDAPCAVTRKSRRRVSGVKIINPYGLLAENPAMPSLPETLERNTQWLFNPLGAFDTDE
jgi:hypothetical protein